MNTILELSGQEVQGIKDTLLEYKQVFKTNAPALFEDGFMVITSSDAKSKNFKIINQLDAASADAEAENQPDTKELSIVFNIVLNICAQIFRAGLTSIEEFTMICDELALKKELGAQVKAVFTDSYLPRISQLNENPEDTEKSMNAKMSKQFPLNLQMSDDMLHVSNPRLVDVEWRTVYTLASKNLSKMHQPKFKITLTLLC